MAKFYLEWIEAVGPEDVLIDVFFADKSFDALTDAQQWADDQRFMTRRCIVYQCANDVLTPFAWRPGRGVQWLPFPVASEGDTKEVPSEEIPF